MNSGSKKDAGDSWLKEKHMQNLKSESIVCRALEVCVTCAYSEMRGSDSRGASPGLGKS